jgi:signal transduction histidine kinase
VKLRYIIPSNFPTLISTDRKRLEQILINLITNSIKFTYEGYIEVRAELVSRRRINANLFIEEELKESEDINIALSDQSDEEINET